MSRSGYYKWVKRKPTKTEKRLKYLISCIQKVYDEHKGIYGYRRITIYLNHYLHAQVNH
ncbi:IS3 family transposase [Oceanobacillus luteolus]|uniref:IS3 family transposase n=1 Tax=Oceanobacillus luteolus TaxID=1274358 RepID=A0ABW4HRZ2_9BACI